MTKFKSIVENLPPEHDYPAGLIHPYWARKPLNIIESIICFYSEEGDTVADPFMGSGTSIVAAIKNKRNAIGGDLSPVSKLLVDGILNSSKQPEKYKAVLNSALENWTEFAIFLNETECGKCVERESYFVDGEYVNGQFNLIFEEAKLKPISNNELKGKIELTKSVKYKNKLPQNKLNKPINFSKIEFTENTRIAVHKGAKASDFFTNRNMVFINHAQRYISENIKCNEEIDFLKLFLSSLIPMLRLSDKKASSQWPYWRPKKELTSRNPIVAIKRRHKSFMECLNWESGALNSDDVDADVFQISADDFKSIIPREVDLIITDPPYADHAPYLEYSDLYWSIVNGERTQSLWNKEIVKTNAIGREKDSNDYELRMFNSICNVLSCLKMNGYFIFFYLDKNLNNWEAIRKAIISSGCITEDVIAIPKQRRSMKAVTSPGKTLDGDLIVICKKSTESIKRKVTISFEDIISEISGDTYFERFGQFIKKYLTSEITEISEFSIKDISRMI